MTPPDENPPLRIGVLVVGTSIPDWLARAVAEASARGIGSLVVVAIAERAGNDAAYAPARAALAVRVIEKLDEWLLGGSRVPEHPLSTWQPGTPRITVTLSSAGDGERLDADGRERLRSHALDVLVLAASRAPSGAGLEDVATYGIWWFEHGDDGIPRAGTAGLWDVLEDRHTTSVTLRRYDPVSPPGTALARTVARTRRFSIARNREALFPRSARILVRSLERAHRYRDPRQPSVAASGESGTVIRSSDPTSLDVLTLVPRVAARFLARRLRWVGRDSSWTLAWHYAPGSSGAAPHRTLADYVELAVPKRRLWADPFLVRDADRWWLFFEDLPANPRIGVIRVVEIGPTGVVGEPKLALDAPVHLSYPCVFRHQGEWFMLPETKAAGHVALYRATRFPLEWRLDRILIDGVTAVDATIHHAGSHWYIFTSLSEPGIESSEELHLFVADSLTGPFRVHPQSPVVTDVRRARMAGRLFEHDGHLYRPAQSAVPYYGSAVVVHRVETLSPDEYREVPAYELSPRSRPGLLGIHTINAADGLSVVDFFRPG